MKTPISKVQNNHEHEHEHVHVHKYEFEHQSSSHLHHGRSIKTSRTSNNSLEKNKSESHIRFRKLVKSAKKIVRNITSIEKYTDHDPEGDKVRGLTQMMQLNIDKMQQIHKHQLKFKRAPKSVRFTLEDKDGIIADGEPDTSTRRRKAP